MSSNLRVLTTYEWGGPENTASPPGTRPLERRWGRWGWAVVGVLSAVWAEPVFCPTTAACSTSRDGRSSRFWAASVRPDASPDFIATVRDATLTTPAFAVLGTVLAVLVGTVVGVLVSETWWNGRPGRMTSTCRVGWALSRVGLSLPRGIHEAVWALFMLTVLGRGPLVGILAIVIPFGAITAKVYSEMIDEADHAAYDALRRLGAWRLPALLYGMPDTASQLISYAFYGSSARSGRRSSSG